MGLPLDQGIFDGQLFRASMIRKLANLIPGNAHIRRSGNRVSCHHLVMAIPAHQGSALCCSRDGNEASLPVMANPVLAVESNIRKPSFQVHD